MQGIRYKRIGLCVYCYGMCWIFGLFSAQQKSVNVCVMFCLYVCVRACVCALCAVHYKCKIRTIMRRTCTMHMPACRIVKRHAGGEGVGSDRGIGNRQMGTGHELNKSSLRRAL